MTEGIYGEMGKYPTVIPSWHSLIRAQPGNLIYQQEYPNTQIYLTQINFFNFRGKQIPYFFLSKIGNPISSFDGDIFLLTTILFSNLSSLPDDLRDLTDDLVIELLHRGQDAARFDLTYRILIRPLPYPADFLKLQTEAEDLLLLGFKIQENL